MNTESVQCNKVDVISKPGDFKFSEERDYLYIWIPGTTGPDAIPISNLKHPRNWLWDGNEDSPSLSPSLHCVGEWHGYLTSGYLQSC